MSRTLDIRPEAEADIEEGFRHYHDFSATLGSDFIDELDAVLSYIRENPAHYQSVHRDLRRALLKRFPFAVFYTFSDHVVFVFAVLHQASDPQRWRRP